MNKLSKFLIIFIMSFLIIGELDFRFTPRLQRLSYTVDNELLWRLSPNQVGYEWLAQMSQKSPPLKINSMGYRGDEFDLNKSNHIRILAVGSSSTLGTGVKEEDVWHSKLQTLLQAQGIQATVMNGANPGWGPFQHATFVQQESDRMQPNFVLVFVSKSDLNFLPIESTEEKQQYLEKAKRRKQLLSFSPFATYSLRKLESFITPKLNQLQAYVTRSQERLGRHASYSTEDIKNNFEKHRVYWQQLINFSIKEDIPLVFYVTNLENNPVNSALHQYLENMTSYAEHVEVFELTSVEGKVNDKFDQKYLIPNDGHPNHLYHQAMAEDLAKLLPQRLLR